MTKRLEAALCEIEGDIVCDIGTDHGKLPAAAVLRGIVKKALAVDISPKSLDKAVKLAAEYSLSDRIETRLGDGFDAVAFDDADTFVIAGMGGHSIIQMLKGKEPLAKNKFVFVPHKNSRALREFLIYGGYIILKDRAIEDCGKFYDIITACFCPSENALRRYTDIADGKITAAFGTQEPSELFLEYGRDNFVFENTDFYIKLTKSQNEFDRFLKKVYNKDCEVKLKSVNKAAEIYQTLFCCSGGLTPPNAD
ncbi:MAG: class I SAM-dependent methyltransferase [Clostridiales bacterium]|jgi:tRNA A22 N-methylase|nr:class I SAM-dependent methyltransferase [Clostridiales bacterium]